MGPRDDRAGGLEGAVGPALAPYTADRDQALAALAALDGVAARWILPGHGGPWTGGVSEALRLIRSQSRPPAVRAA